MNNENNTDTLSKITLRLTPTRCNNRRVQEVKSLLKEFNATNIIGTVTGLSVVVTADNFPDSDDFIAQSAKQKFTLN
ncbi:MAG: hypothetical protein COB76_03245 [Alphaproteobacteria bacterium]|nr:MAG: hypothetical protein COB76_03245 [Alphaproteobacteria bacterium]